MPNLDVAYILHNNLDTCPVKGFPLYLMDGKRDEWDIQRYFLTMFADDYHSPKYTETDRIALALWLKDILLPALNLGAPVFLDVRDSGDVFE